MRESAWGGRVPADIRLCVRSCAGSGTASPRHICKALRAYRVASSRLRDDARRAFLRSQAGSLQAIGLFHVDIVALTRPYVVFVIDSRPVGVLIVA